MAHPALENEADHLLRRRIAAGVGQDSDTCDLRHDGAMMAFFQFTVEYEPVLSNRDGRNMIDVLKKTRRVGVVR